MSVSSFWRCQGLFSKKKQIIGYIYILRVNQLSWGFTIFQREGNISSLKLIIQFQKVLCNGQDVQIGISKLFSIVQEFYFNSAVGLKVWLPQKQHPISWNHVGNTGSQAPSQLLWEWSPAVSVKVPCGWCRCTSLTRIATVHCISQIFKGTICFRKQLIRFSSWGIRFFWLLKKNPPRAWQ